MRAALARWGPLVLLAAALLLLARNAWRFPGSDFVVYHRAARHFAAGAPLYGLDDPRWPLQRFRYLPGTAALFSPLAALPYRAARGAWLALSAACALAAAAALSGRRRGRWAAPLAAILLFHPLAQELQLGQVHLAVLAALCAARGLERRGRELPAGLLVGIAAGLKLTPALLVVDALLRRRWRVAAGFAAALALLAAAAIARYGPAGALAEHAAWWRSQRALGGELLGSELNQSIFGLVLGLVRGRAGEVLATVAAAALVLAALAARPPALRWALLVGCTVVASPNGWVQGYVLLLPLAALLLAGPPGAAFTAGALALGTGLLAYDVLGRAGEAWALAHHLLALDALALLLLGRLVPRAASPPPTAASPHRDDGLLAAGRS